MKNGWVEKDLKNKKRPKKRCSEENGAVQNAIKNRTRKKKNTVEEDQ